MNSAISINRMEYLTKPQKLQVFAYPKMLGSYIAEYPFHSLVFE